MKWIAVVLSFFVSVSAFAADQAYDEQADANKEIQQALVDAAKAKVPVILVFGANWCPDCRALDKAMHGSSEHLIERDFDVVKIDFGNFDKNLELANRYGNPIAKGIPAVVVVGNGDRVLYSTKAGELANASKMSEQSIYDFLKQKVAQQAVKGS